MEGASPPWETVVGSTEDRIDGIDGDFETERVEPVDDIATSTPVLAVCDFSANLGKIERHIGPLADTAEPTMVCITADETVDGVDYRTVPDLGWRPISLLCMFFAAILEAYRGEYEAVVSFSLVPHGCFALVIGRAFGLPVHLGVIGADLDVHARARYGTAVAFLLRRFDVVSVPGTTHRRQLLDLGVNPDRTALLSNPIDPGRYRPDPEIENRYDLLWVGRFDAEKDPITFVDACAALAERGVEFRAAMVGDGPLRPVVERRLYEIDGRRGTNLRERIERTGWVEDPLYHYQRGRIFALTSRRDALPLTLIEAMATGCVPVVAPVGNVRDAAVDGENALVLDSRTPDAFAEAFATLLSDAERLERFSQRSSRVRDRYTYAEATEDWQTILRRLLVERGNDRSLREKTKYPAH